MIKHRFIVSREDFRIFAAIPTEVRLLTWKRWSRPSDWQALSSLYDEAASIFEKLEVYWNEISSGYLVVSKVVAPTLEDVAPAEVEEDIRRMRGAQSAECAIIAGTCREVLANLRQIGATLSQRPEDLLARSSLSLKDEVFGEALEALAHLLTPSAKGDVSVDLEALKTSSASYAEYYDRMNVRAGEQVRLKSNVASVGAGRTSEVLSKQETKSIREYAHTMWEAHDALCALMQLVVERRLDIINLLERAKELLSCEPTVDVECPPGVPFAAYTVELGDDVVVNVVEGCAWVEGRKETEDEHRVTEILSQMLTERGLNPKADTRVPIREVDPKHAARQRDAEQRPGPPRVRTIKFLATPPRYLREAAEYILASPRRAHWVVGHWRNQAFGEKMSQRHQKWIKPHIRGLGEASAATTRVTAPKDEETRRRGDEGTKDGGEA